MRLWIGQPYEIFIECVHEIFEDFRYKSDTDKRIIIHADTNSLIKVQNVQNHYLHYS